MTVTYKTIEDAAHTLKGHVVRTPLLHSMKLSAMTGAEIFVKCENFQVTNSFKDRGAYLKLASLTEEQRTRGVITMSAGNHAQAVAWHAQRLGIPATIVMPENTPTNKVERTLALGATVVLFGEQLADSQMKVAELAAEKYLTLVHPYDDDHVIAGQGTVALEMLEDCPDLDMLVVPIGGGGLMAGMAVAARHIKPSIGIIGAEVKLYPSMSLALAGKAPAGAGTTLAEGIAVKNVAARTIDLCRGLVDQIVLLDEADVERAIIAFLTEQKLLAEGAGAAGLAAVLARPELFRGRTVGLVLCGGSIDPRILASVITRQLQREGRIVTMRIMIDDRPGILGRIATLVGTLKGNILEVRHDRTFLDVPAKGAELELTLELRDAAHAEAIRQGLAAEGFVVTLLQGH